MGNDQSAQNLLWLVPLCPFVGFIVCAFLGRLQDKTVGDAHDSHAVESHATVPTGQKPAGFMATLAVVASFVVALLLVLQITGMNGAEKRLFSSHFDWMYAPGIGSSKAFNVGFGLFADPLNGLMLLIITGVGALIHLYSIGYMSHERNFARYFSYLNLFVFFMLLLVMGSNLLVLFIGWEGVGLASYLLIGFWQDRKSATDAGKKAFIVNRIGDCALLIGLFLIYRYFGTLEMYGADGILTKAGIDTALANGYASNLLLGGATAATLVPLFLLIGATGKSAQIPLFVWLPDAMEGPTPVSALIHAATMVTGGVYLICRTHALFLLSPDVMTAVAVIGLATAFVAATIALTQNDIKRVLAYSTVSQLGYMFLACGVGAFGAAMFHVATHAFFKALLFLGAGSVIHGMSGEQDMRKMGGLRAKMPTTFLTMLIGTLAIAGVPPLAGFWSKDEILLNAYAGSSMNGLGHWSLWAVGWVVSALTAFYMMRLLMKTFFGTARYDKTTADHLHESPVSMTAPLAILALFSLIAGFANAGFLGHAFDNFLGETVDWRAASNFPLRVEGIENILLPASAVLAIVVCIATYAVFNSHKTGDLSTQEKMSANPVWRFFDSQWGINGEYNRIFANGGLDFSRWLWRIFDRHIVDGLALGAGGLVGIIAGVFRGWQSGYVRNYALSMLIGILLVVGALVGLNALH